MVVNSTYLGDSGITSTSANFLANLAKETIRELEKELKNLQFYDKNVELISGEKKKLSKHCVELNSLESTLNKIASMYSFCAWVREAIKEKEALLEKVSNYTIFDYGREFNVTIPERPDGPKEVKEEDIINEMSIKERNRYLTVETFAATFGKYIHPDGEIANARDDFHDRMTSPTKVIGTGRDMVIYTYTSDNTIKDVDDTFIYLQSKQREYEKQLNSLKYKIKEEMNKRNTYLKSQFQAAYNEFRANYSIINTEAEKVRISKMEEVSKLKILIPDALKDTYEYLESLVK